jgi:hypothetical protein
VAARSWTGRSTKPAPPGNPTFWRMRPDRPPDRLALGPEGVLDLLDGLLEVGPGLVGSTLSLQPSVAGGSAGGLLDLTLELLCLVAGLVPGRPRLRSLSAISPSSGSADLVGLPAAAWGETLGWPVDLGSSWSLARIEPTPSSGEDPRPRWQTAWYLPGRRGPRPLRGAVTAQGPSRAAHLHPSGVAQGHEPLTMDRRPSAVLAHVLAGCA